MQIIRFNYIVSTEPIICAICRPVKPSSYPKILVLQAGRACSIISSSFSHNFANSMKPIQRPLNPQRFLICYKSNRSSSSSQSPFLRLITILPVVPPSLSLFSATAPSNSFSWSSVTLALSWPDFANMISRFSTSVARDSLTRRIRPSRSAASGSSICERIALRASAVSGMTFSFGVKAGSFEPTRVLDGGYSCRRTILLSIQIN